MKKALVLLLCLATIFVLSSCKKEEATTATTANTTTTTTATTVSEPVVKEETYKLGIGVVFVDNATESEASYDATVAVVVTDEEGKIVAVKLDDAQNKMKGDSIDALATFRTKKEKQFDYNMVKYSEATNEWFQQAAAFESYCIGKTADEVANIATRVRGEDEPHPGYVVAADEALFASCSINIVEFKDAIVKAAKDSKAQTFTTSDSFKLGLSVATTADESTEATADKDGSIKMYVDFGGAVVGKDGKILASITDSIQPSYTVDADGVVSEASYKGTKKELEYNYNMVKYSEATNEWFQQAAAFEQYCVGKTGDEVIALPTRVRGENEAHPGYVVTTDETLFASCSIQITSMKGLIGTAAKNAD